MNVKKLLGIKGLLGWCIAGVIALAISSMFVLIYNYSGTHIANPSGATDYKWMPGQYKAGWSEGINYMHMDENGFNNLSSDIADIDILLMGGSHMEAVQFGTEYNAGSLLNDYIPNLKTYNIGMSGHQILNCLSNVEAAIDEYNPSGYVVIQIGDVNVTTEDLQATLDGTLPDIPSYDSGIMYRLQRIPALKVIYKQLTDKLSIDRSSGYSDSEEIQASEISAKQDQMDEKIVIFSQLFDQKNKICDENGVKLLIVYTPKVEVDTDGSLYRADDEAWISALKKSASNAGVTMIDCFDAMKEEYDTSYSLPFGFNNATMGSGHLNKTGHKIVAQEIARIINEMPNHSED